MFEFEQIKQAVEDADGVYVSGPNGQEKYISATWLIKFLAQFFKEEV